MSITNKFASILPILIESANKCSLYYRLAAVTLINNKLYRGPSVNTNRTYYRNYETETFSLHAEANAIINSYGKDLNYIHNMKNFHVKNKNIKKLDLLVIRVNNSGKLCNSRPCIYCLKMMKDVKIKRVYYIINCLRFSFILRIKFIFKSK